jgi:hypothetical protein
VYGKRSGDINRTGTRNELSGGDSTSASKRTVPDNREWQTSPERLGVSMPMAVRPMRIVVSGGSTMSKSGMSLGPTIEGRQDRFSAAPQQHGRAESSIAVKGRRCILNGS